MKKTLGIIFVAGLFAIVFSLGHWACGDNTGQTETVCQDGIDNDGDGYADCADSDCASQTVCGGTGFQDLGTTEGGSSDSTIIQDTTSQPPILQTIANSITLPKSGTDYAIDLNGDGTPDNKIGSLIGTLGSLASGMDLQTSLDAKINDGTIMLLFELLGPSQDLVNNTNVTVQMHVGQDLDGDASDNFSGSEPLGLSPNSPSNIILSNGSITSSSLTAGPGTLIIPLVIGESSSIITLKKSYIKATVSSTGLANGILAGAITENELDAQLLPLLIQLIDGLDPSIKTIVMLLFDTNPKDGTLSASEIKNNAMLAAYFTPDVDTDNDSVPDALSLGVGFTAVKCQINK